MILFGKCLKLFSCHIMKRTYSGSRVKPVHSTIFNSSNMKTELISLSVILRLFHVNLSAFLATIASCFVTFWLRRVQKSKF